MEIFRNILKKNPLKVWKNSWEIFFALRVNHLLHINVIFKWRFFGIFWRKIHSRFEKLVKKFSLRSARITLCIINVKFKWRFFRIFWRKIHSKFEKIVEKFFSRFARITLHKNVLLVWRFRRKIHSKVWKNGQQNFLPFPRIRLEINVLIKSGFFRTFWRKIHPKVWKNS